MAVDLTLFAGTVPYAAELIGVYQPLLGWKSRRKRQRFHKQHAMMLGTAITKVAAKGPSRAEILGNPQPTNPFANVSVAAPGVFDGQVGRHVQQAASAFAARTGRYPADAAEWQAVLASADLNGAIRAAAARQAAGRGSGPVRAVQSAAGTSPGAEPVTVHMQLGPAAVQPAAAHPSAAQRLLGSSVAHEAAAAGVITHMASTAPQALSNLLTVSNGVAATLLGARDPLADFDPTLQRAVLSPIGLITLYREYFFELDTFLGPPVGHVWVSPGGMVELYEVHTRRTRQEREVEVTNESTTKSETESSEEDELSTAVSEENSRDISMGVTASGGVNFGVVEASASASLGLEFNHKVGQETAHKHTRKQSEKLANEIRRSFKTVIRTSVETEDVASRRHVLQNTTDRLVNYELRRKMRQVGVQVQHIGTQMCWQVFVDEPGQALGLSSLVHAAADPDLSGLQPPEAPAAQPPKKTQYVLDFAFEALDEEATDDGLDETYENGEDVDTDAGTGLIRWTKTINIDAPAAGYGLNAVTIVSFAGTDPDEDPPEVTATCTVSSAASFDIALPWVKFNDNPAIRFTFDLVWSPPEVSEDAKKAYEEKQQQYEDATTRAHREAYLKTVRERIKLASHVEARPEKDLREEERTVIYRRLITQLTGIKDGTTQPHLISELIRAIFDVDKMLYFVAPEWWRPHENTTQQLGDSATLTADDMTNWGNEPGRPNYLITEESNPARLGSSLGWTIQLDGDSHRNAFLNSPWVKAVIPIRPGREQSAINWLKLAHVEGSEDLDAQYGGTEPGLVGHTIEEVLDILANRIENLGTDITNTLATETVFERGFDPLEGGFRVAEPFEVFDQWVEVLPTDQVVAVEYEVSP